MFGLLDVQEDRRCGLREFFVNVFRWIMMVMIERNIRTMACLVCWVSLACAMNLELKHPNFPMYNLVWRNFVGGVRS